LKSEKSKPEKSIEGWIERVVIGLELCPFAKGVVRQDQLTIVVLEHKGLAEALQSVADEAAMLLASGQIWNTKLLVFESGFSNFDDFLDLYYLADDLLKDLGYEGQLQLASFHPDYQFENSDMEDVSNWTNRAPLPVLHLLQEASVTQAVLNHRDPEGIAQRNIEHLQALGLEAVKSLAYSAE